MITNVGNPILKYTINILNLPFKGWFIEVLCSWLLRSDEWMPLYRDWCDGRSFNALLKDHPPTWWVRFRRNYPQDPCIYGIYANIWGILMGSMLPYIYIWSMLPYIDIYIYIAYMDPMGYWLRMSPKKNRVTMAMRYWWIPNWKYWELYPQQVDDIKISNPMELQTDCESSKC